MMQEYTYPHPEAYDGVSEFQHVVCGRREGRWSGRELVDDDYEYRYGRP